LRKVVFANRRFYVYSDGSISKSTMLFSEWFDYDSLHFVDEFLRPSDNFLDIGANVGLFTLLASRRMLDSIACIEPGFTQGNGLGRTLRKTRSKRRYFRLQFRTI
jgi:hypothetical protein